jgi:hypothetical protein
MAGLRGNQAYLLGGKQTGRGVPATTFAARWPFSGGDLSPTRAIDQLSETDANRDEGTSYVQQTAAEGSPEVYVRDNSVHLPLYYALGAISTSAGPTNFTHTLTPANTLPYVTFGKMLGATLYEQYEDCMVSELTVSADAGSPLTAAFSVQGRKSIRQAAEWATPPAQENGAVYNFNEAAVTLGGGATSLVSSFEMTYTNNVSTQQTDDSVPYDVVPGLRSATLGFRLIFEDLVEYNKFHYGGAAGTTQSPNIFTTSAAFTFTKGVNNEVSFTFPNIAYEEFGAAPDPGGDPIVVDVRARTQRSGSPIVTAVVKNQNDGTDL